MSGRRRALIIACDSYEHVDLRRLPAAAEDATALGEVLADAAIGGFTVDVVRNEPAHVIQERMEDFLSDNRTDDVLLIHFSCHGLKNDTGELFFAARNTRPQRLRATAIPADFVHRCMQQSKSRNIVLFLDCCYGGAFPRGAIVRAAGDVNVLDSFPDVRAGGHGHVVITASGSAQYAFEGDTLLDGASPRPSVFTEAIVHGLATGDADRDRDGLISLSELYGYVCDRVLERNPRQTPSRLGEARGEMYLARSRRQRIVPAALPPDLDAARKDPSIYARRGAISELRIRLGSEDLRVAVGAWEALTELANDIAYVAVDARAALADAAVRPDTAAIEFEELERRISVSPRRTLRLLGPAIARACQLEPSHAWIRVTEVPEGYEVWVDTSIPGPLDHHPVGSLAGHITVTGPTGKAVITVQGRVSAQQVAPTEVRASPGSDTVVGQNLSFVEEPAGEIAALTGSTPTNGDIEDYLAAGRSLRAGARKLRGQRTPGPVRFEVNDKDGERTTSDVRQLPPWAVRKLIQDFGTPSDSFDDPYTWAKALLDARGTGWSSVWGDGNGSLRASRSHDGPIRYIVTEGEAMREYSRLADVPDLNDFKRALAEEIQRKRDQSAIKERLDALFGKQDDREEIGQPGGQIGVRERASEEGAVKPGGSHVELAISNYDELATASLRARLRNLNTGQLRELIEYERANAGRTDVITLFERRINKLEEG